MASARYNILNTRISRIEGHLLPPINPTGTYSEKEEDLTRSYCILCHAEIEAYIEDRISSTTTAIVDKWKLDKHKVHPIIFHLAFNYKQENNKPKEPPYGMVISSYLNLLKIIGKNNGIKEDNISNIIKPIGFEIDNTLGVTLTSFGVTRGNIAHQSFQTQQPLDPATQKANIKNILIGLKDFDVSLDSYENTGNISIAPSNLSWSKPNLYSAIIRKFKLFIYG